MGARGEEGLQEQGGDRGTASIRRGARVEKGKVTKAKAHGPAPYSTFLKLAESGQQVLRYIDEEAASTDGGQSPLSRPC